MASGRVGRNSLVIAYLTKALANYPEKCSNKANVRDGQIERHLLNVRVFDSILLHGDCYMK